jgi:GcrA cell cycle regulator
MKNKANKIKSVIHLDAGDCRWPIGDPRHADFHFCAAQQTPGRPYCAHHWQMSFDVSKSRYAASPAAIAARRAA